MSSTSLISPTSVIPPSFNSALYCTSPRSYPQYGCPGLCPNPDVTGVGGLISFILSSIISGVSMIWLPLRGDRRLQYYIHYLQSWGRLAAAIYFYEQNRMNTYDAYFVVYLVAGADANGIIGGAAGLDIVEFPLTTLQPLASSLATLLLVLMASGQLKSFGDGGSQPFCHFNLNLWWLIPMGIIIVVVYVLVLASATRQFNALFMRSFTHLFGLTLSEIKRAELLLRIFWTIVLMGVDVYWIIAVTQFIHWYNDNTPFLNPNQYHITQAQILAIFLAAITLIPVAKTILIQVKIRTRFERAEIHRRQHRDILADQWDIVSGREVPLLGDNE